MKRIITVLLTLSLLLAVLVLPMTSCSAASRLARMDEEEQAVKLFELSNERLNAASSFFMEQTMTLKMSIGGAPYEQTANSRITAVDGKDGLVYLEQSESSVVVDGSFTVIYEDSGYADGFMFARYKENADELKLKSPITVEEYAEFRSEMAEYSTIDVEVEGGLAETLTCERHKDKTWTATYEGFTEAGMKPFMKMLAGIEYTVTAEHTVKDVRMTWKTDADLRPTETSIEFIFEKKPGAKSDPPVLSVTTVYKGVNNTVLTSPYDISDFTEVEDLRLMERFTAALRDRETASEGSFTVDSQASLRVIGGEEQKSHTVHDITFKNRDGMELSVSYEEDGYYYDMSYSDGKMRMIVKEMGTDQKVADETLDMTDAEAQATVTGSMNSGRFGGIDLTDGRVTSAEKGTYRFTLGEITGRRLGEVYEAELGGKQTDFNGYIEATVVNGKLLRYKYRLFHCLKAEGATIYINAEITVEFHEAVEDSGTV